MRDLMLLLRKAVEPKVLAKSHLRDQFPVRGEMVVEMVRFKVFRRAFKVADVEAYVEVCLQEIAGLRDLIPSEFLDSASVVRLSCD